ncbi:unnamed protein product [Phytophthora fragariaefolia]|uniref:Unnamed protein product n=1 Tax=Phytophthora fragariaefolia TaxID=1490495 RepID=A0A9W6XPR9_9STRA|nr:unnamed protein product [Phytophthora fragariaefolia]
MSANRILVATGQPIIDPSFEDPRSPWKLVVSADTPITLPLTLRSSSSHIILQLDNMAPNREICAFFYEDKGQGDYRCQLCGASHKQQVDSGNSNLMFHLNSTYLDFEETYQASVATNAPLSSFGFVSEATHHRYQWLQWVVERNMPISEVDNRLTRSMSSWKPVSSKTLKLDMQTCSAHVGRTIEKELGEIFGTGRTMARGRQSRRGSPHCHVQAVLALLYKRISMVAFLVADNCATNKRIAMLMDLPLVGCESHRYNLAVIRYLVAFASELADVDTLVVQLRHVNNAAELAKYGDLKPIKRNVIRCFDLRDGAVTRKSVIPFERLMLLKVLLPRVRLPRSCSTSWRS